MKTNQEIAKEVIAGKWGNDYDRRQRLEAAGYNYNAVQSIVNAIINGSYKEPVTLNVDVDLSKYDSITLNFTGV